MQQTGQQFPTKVNLLNLSRTALKNFFSTLGEKPFRAQQVMQWIYQQGCADFYSMTNLHHRLRVQLSEIATIQAPQIVSEQRATDGTIKWALAVGDQMVETVYIPEVNRGTLCLSSQVGCVLACRFCSTAQQGFNRNLQLFEIIGQIWRAKQRLQMLANDEMPPITNIVLMGMGEPLLNLAQVVPALEIMLDSCAYGFSKRRVTLSTSGVVPALDKLAGCIDVALAVSLHAPNDPLRDQLVPINRQYNIACLLASVRHYLAQSKANRGRVTIEYVMLHQINDTLAHAEQLVMCLKETPSKINLIPWNPFPYAAYHCSSATQIDRFARYLVARGLTVTIRKTRGAEIDGACGQLAGRVIDRTQRTAKKVNNGELIALQCAAD